MGTESPLRESGVEPQERLWQPFTVHGPNGERRQSRRAFNDDNYVVVEDIDDGRGVFEASSWQQVDRGGRLHFEREPSELYDELPVAQEVIDEARGADGVTGSDRPLRVGDVFSVKGLALGADSINSAGTIRDVAVAARLAAKAALLGAEPCVMLSLAEKQDYTRSSLADTVSGDRRVGVWISCLPVSVRPTRQELAGVHLG